MADRLAHARELVPTGSHWVHYKKPDDPYEIVAVGFLESTEEAAVVYRNLGSGLIWIRPLENFLSRVEYNGVSGARFRRVDERKTHLLGCVLMRLSALPTKGTDDHLCEKPRNVRTAGLQYQDT